jgi:uncharacterized protein YigE (DUF2233 family)
MKRLILVSLSALVVAGIYFGLLKWRDPVENTLAPSPEVLGVPTSEKGVEIEIGERKFLAFYLEVPDASNITLIPNFDQAKNAFDLFAYQDCAGVVSGGFYTPEGTPTGFFISEGETLKKYTSSSLLNGVYSINDFATPRIGKAVPRDHLRLGLQAGPVLIENSYEQNLKLIRDEEARRVVVGVTGENKTVFIVFYDPESVFIGPMLEDMPQALELFGEKTGVVLADAMNLDGGSASAFFTAEVNLSEASPVGSFFCVK